jgi:hypothetical protein
MRVYGPGAQHWAWSGPHRKHFFQYIFYCWVRVFRALPRNGCTCHNMYIIPLHVEPHCTQHPQVPLRILRFVRRMQSVSCMSWETLTEMCFLWPAQLQPYSSVGWTEQMLRLIAWCRLHRRGLSSSLLNCFVSLPFFINETNNYIWNIIHVLCIRPMNLTTFL